MRGAVAAADPRHRGRGAPARRPRAGAPRRSRPRPAYEQPLLELGLPPAPRALPVSRLSYSGLEAYRRCGYRFFLERTLRLAAVARPPAAASRRARAESRSLRGSIVHGLLERLDFATPGRARRRRASPRPSSGTGEDPRPEDVADMRGDARARGGLRSCASASPPLGACAPSCRSPSRSRRRRRRPQPAHQRRRGRARARGRAYAGRGLEERRARGARSRGAGRGVLRDAALVYALAALGRAPRGRGGALLPRAPGRAGRGASTRPATPKRSSGSCSSWPRASSRAASSPPPSRISRSVRTVRDAPRCACTIPEPDV